MNQQYSPVASILPTASVTPIRPVILCGGAGSRLWPVSRDTMPKQFAPLLGAKSTFQQTAVRMNRPGFGRPLVVTNHAHQIFAQRQMLEAEIVADYLIEPSRRDSGPAIVAACLAAAREHPEALVLVQASDHVIADAEAFLHAVLAGIPAAAAGRLVTFGITPSRAETGYGYIEPGEPVEGDAAAVQRFAEKPCADVAAQYVKAGMLWNSGNFLFRAASLVDEFRRFDPSTVAAVEDALAGAKAERAVSTLGPRYADATPVSIDYAVMERTDKAAVVAVSCGWSDVGTWDSLWDICPRDARGNVVSGEVELLDSSGCLVSSTGPLTSVVGLRDVVVVANDDAVLVAERHRSGEVKTLVEQMRRNGRAQADAHAKAHRPWGWYQVTDEGLDFKVKRITVNPGGRLSLQKHRFRAEHWVVVSGKATVTVEDKVETLHPNRHVHIPLGAVHRLENFGDVPVELVEVQCGSYLGEDDIVRLEDVYHRT
uniref:mannose-1-phosphate guanylyltransferase n=1 Tax=Rhodopseudomonas palustris (strain BisA53) TaxID=316055 RepID=Q07KV7_RHOP5